MKNDLRVSLWLLLVVMAVPMPIAALTQREIEKQRKFESYIHIYRRARARYYKRQMEGAPFKELAKYEQRMRQAKKGAIALRGYVGFKLAVKVADSGHEAKPKTKRKK